MESLKQLYKTYDFNHTIDILEEALFVSPTQTKESASSSAPDSPIDLYLFPNGKSPNDTQLVSSVLISFLFRSDIPNVVLAITRNCLFMLGTKEKCALVQPFVSQIEKRKQGLKKLILVEKTEEEFADIKRFNEMICEEIPKRPHVGYINEQMSGKLVTKWIEEADKIWPKEHRRLIDKEVRSLVSRKRPQDSEYIDISSKLLTEYFNSVKLSLDEAALKKSKITHDNFSAKLAVSFEKTKEAFCKREGADADFVVFPLNPQIQSGTGCSMKQIGPSSDKEITYDNVIVNIVMGYLDFHTQAARTYIFNPSEAEKEDYKVILNALETLINGISPDQPISKAYSAVHHYLLVKRPHWVSYLPSNFGTTIGLNLRTPGESVGPNSDYKPTPGQVFCVWVGVSKAGTKSNRSYFVADTIKIGQKGSSNVNLTKDIARKYQEICQGSDHGSGSKGRNSDDYDSDRKAKKTKKPIEAESSREGTKNTKGGIKPENGPVRILTRQQRKASSNPNFKGSQSGQENARIIKHQAELLRNLTKELKERLANNSFILPGTSKPSDQQNLEDVVAFKSRSDVPKLTDTTKLQIDMKNNVLWVPLSGKLVAFHVSVIKNISVQHEGKTSVFRINFNVPGRSNKYANVFSKTTKNPIYIQELTFRSSVRDHYDKLLTDFKTMVKEFNPLLHLKDQGSEGLITNNGKKPVLDDLLMRPALSGKKCIGRLEVHKNGFRFKTKRNEEVDILFDNISYSFYQKAMEHEMVLIHFHLKSAMVLGGKKTTEVQFYSYIGTFADELMSDNKKKTIVKNRRSFNDDDENDEIYDQAKSTLEKAFESFIAAAEKETNGLIRFEDIHSEDGFTGAYNYASDTIYPTDSCFVSLQNPPYLVIPFSEVEIIAFERTGMINRTFDMTAVWKDYSRPVVTISGISSALKSAILEVLDERNIVVIESVGNLKWSSVLKRIGANLEEFVNEHGGWAYYAANPELRRGANSHGVSADEGESYAEDASDELDGSDYVEDGGSESEETYSEGENSSAEGDSKDSSSDGDGSEGVLLFSDEGSQASSDDLAGDDDYEQDSQDSFIVKSKEKKKPGNSNRRR